MSMRHDRQPKRNRYHTKRPDPVAREKRRGCTRWWCIQFPALLLLFILGWLFFKGIVYLRQPTTLPIRQVVLVSASPHVTATQLQQVVLSHSHGGFFSLDQQAVARSIRASNPWIAALSIERVFPSTLRISVQEYVAYAQWGSHALITQDGHIFSPAVSTWPSGLPRLDAADEERVAVITQYQQMQAALSALKLRLVRFSRSARDVIVLTLVTESGTAKHRHSPTPLVVTLGREDVAARLQRFITYYPRVIGSLPVWKRRRIRSVDMRYAHGFAVGK